MDADDFILICVYLRYPWLKQQHKMSKIQNIQAQEILDSRGNPAMEFASLHKNRPAASGLMTPTESVVLKR